VADLQFLTRIHYLAPSDATWGEHEVDYIFFAQPSAPVSVAMEPNEVQAVRYVTADELRQLMSDAGTLD
jgi:isopentenyl-diphosphate delta-isomerase